MERGERVRWIVGAALVAGLHAGAAAADSVFYGELWTSQHHGEITMQTDPGNLLEGLQDADLNDLGPGFGDGSVSGGDPLFVTLTFAPDGYTVNDVLEATVYVSVVDDQLFDGRETAAIRVDGSLLDSGNAFLNLLEGDVTAWIGAVGDTIYLGIFAPRGTFQVLGTAMTVHFDGTATRVPAIPEPAAAFVFALGLALVRRARF